MSRSTLGSLSLSQRIMLSFALLITFVATLYAVAVAEAIEFAETHIVTQMLDDELERVRSVLNDGRVPQLPENELVFGNHPLIDPIPSKFAHASEGYSEVTDAPAVFLYRNSRDGLTLLLVRDQEGFEQRERTIQHYVFVSVLVVFVLAALVGWILSRAIMRPVESLAGAVKRNVGETVYHPLPAPAVEDEVGELALLCDRALREVHEALQREKAFTGDVSHELRTPLTVIRTSTELLEMTELSEAQRVQVGRIGHSARVMSELLTLFLELARQSERRSENLETAAGVVGWMEDVWSGEAKSRGLELLCRPTGLCPGVYPVVRISSVLNNLLKNAVAYTPAGKIWLAEVPEGFLVADTGPGIAPSEREQVFEAFRRGQSSFREGAEEGAGLGLSIARKLCSRNRWTLELIDPGAVSDAGTREVLNEFAGEVSGAGLRLGAVFRVCVLGGQALSPSS